MSTYNPVAETTKTISEEKKQHEIRVNSYIHNISCINCDTVVTDCNAVLVDDLNIPPNTNLSKVQIHQNQLFVRTGGIELSSKVLKIVGLEITHLSPPINCGCTESNKHSMRMSSKTHPRTESVYNKPPKYQLTAFFPLCHHNTAMNESEPNIHSILGYACVSPHSAIIDQAERYIGVNMFYNKEDNVWESLPEPAIRVECENIVKSAVKRHDIL